MAARATDKNRTKSLVDEKDIPTKWYNIKPDFKSPAPPVLHPGTGQPIGPADLAPLFPMELIKQEVSRARWIEIPDEVRDILKLWRPSPLFRARRLEKALGTPARIYYKYEGVSPAGSHKPNTAVAQAYYNKKEKVTRLSTETGAGQWGSALALASQLFGLQCKVYMVKVSYQQKPYRRIMMETWGAQVVPSPSPDTQAGKKILEEDPNSPGSLGIAISEAVEDAATREDTKDSLGSVLNHVPTHQTVLGHGFIPAPLHAGGLRYHGMAPLVCKLYADGVIEAAAVPQIATFQAALQFAKSEGIIPAPEAAHAIRVVIDEALACKKAGKRKTILFNLSGHGHFDLGAYEAFLAGKLQDFDYPAEKIAEALRGVPEVKA